MNKNGIKLCIKNFFSWVKNGGVVQYRYATPIAFDNKPLADKVVIVTGGTSGIGLETACSLSKMGAKVIITGRNKEKLASALERIDGATGIIWDISNVAISNDKILECKKIYGKIDILINNAGVYDGTQMGAMQEQIFDHIMDTDCKGPYFVSKAFVQNCESSEKNTKKIINILSIRSLTSSTNAYCIAKWAEKCFSDGLAKELLGKNIIVNSVAPGPTASNINGIDPNGNVFYSGNEHIKHYLIPDEIVNVIAFLAADVSNGIVGQTIIVDGGETIR